jgi:DNA-binding NtrC family response regulator
LFTDVVMPGAMDGIELARIAVERWPTLKVVLTSGFPEARIGGNEIAQGEFGVLSKPYRRDDLARTLREVLDSRQSEPG